MLYTSQKMEVSTLIIYFIHWKCVDITRSHHLRLKVQCNFPYATKGFLVVKLIAIVLKSQIVIAN
jgi:hypothetical protein